MSYSSYLLLILATVPIILQVLLVAGKGYHTGLSTAPATKKQGHGDTSEPKTALVPTKPSLCNLLGKCALICQGKVDEFRAQMEERQSRMCQGEPMKVILENVSFPNDIIPEDYFSGAYALETLHISSSSGVKIEGGVFNQPSLANLHTLILDRVYLMRLFNKTFLGLNGLKVLKLHYLWTFTWCSMFLMPLASTLEEAVILLSDRMIKPDEVLGGNNMTALTIVDLSGNRFKGSLTKTTFRTLIKVKHLFLSNCSIYYIDAGTFDIIMPTLRHLDLTANKLKSLDWKFLAKANTHGFILELKSNEWDCNCNNYDMIVAAQMKIIDFVEYPLCSKPDILRDIPVQDVQLDCKGGGSSVATTPKVPTTSMPSPSSTEATSTVKATTAESTPSIRPSIATTPPTSATYTTHPTEVPTTYITYPPDEPTTSMTYPTEEPTTYTSNPPEEATTYNTYPTEEPALTTTNRPRPSLPVTCTTVNASFQFLVWASDATYRITSLSSTSVRLLVGQSMDDTTTIHVLTAHSSHTFKPTSVCQQMQANAECIIEDLVSNQSYVFCMMRNGDHEISPFNCRSHFLQPFEVSLNAWIRIPDVVLFVAIGTGIVIACIVFGCVLTYGILRWRPTLLKGSTRLVRASPESMTMLLYPRNEDSLKDESAEVSQSTINRVSSVASYLAADSSTSWQLASLSSDRSPLQQAPEVPLENILHKEHSVYTSSTIPAENVVQYNSQEMHEYEIVEEYVEVL